MLKLIKMECETEDENILVTEAVLNPVKNRHIMAEKIFEKFKFG